MRESSPDGVRAHGGVRGSTRRALALAGVILLLALALRAVRLADSLWLDEIVSAQLAALPWADRIHELETWDPHPPLFYASVDLLTPSAASEWRLRLVPLLFGLLHLALLAWVGGLLWGRQAALAAAALGAVSWELTWVSFELRSFTLANLLVTLAWAGTLRWLQGGARRWLVVTGVAAAAALQTFYYAAVPLLGLAAFVLVSRPPPRRGWAWLLSGLVAFVLFLPCLPIFLRQVVTVRQQTAVGYGTDPFLDLSSHLTLLRSHVLRLGLPALLAVGTLLGFDLAARVQGRGRHALARAFGDRSLRAVGAYGLACFGLILVAWAAGSFTTSRYATFLTGIWAVFAAGCFARTSRHAGTVLLAVVLLVGGVRTLSHVSRPERDDWRGAVAAVDARADPTETLLVIPGHVRCYEYYSRAGREDVRAVDLPDPRDQAHSARVPELAGRDTVWALWWFHRWGDEQEVGLRALEQAGFPVADSWWFRRLRVTRHERRSPEIREQ